MSGWSGKRLDELCSIEIGRTPARDNPRYWDTDKQTDNVWVSIADMGKAVSASIHGSKEHLSDAGAAITPLVPEGALLLSFKLSLGKLAFAGRPLRTNEAIAALIPNDLRQINKKFLYWYFHSYDWVAAARGSEKIKGATLNKAKLKEITVLLPSLPEQKRIVAILDEAFEGIDTAVASAEKNLANARELFDSYLNSVFAHQGEGWTEKKLEDTVQRTCSLSYGIVQPGEDVDDGLPIVRPTDLRSKIIRLDGLKRITPALADGYKRTELQGGELLLCVRGGTGSVSIAAGEEPVGNFVCGA